MGPNYMVQQVKDERFYHINSNANGSPHDYMRVGNSVEIGQQTNPFFRFYETYQRTYSVTNIDTNQVELMPAMMFLHRVKKGTIKTDQLPAVAHETANHFLMLSRELFWENIRLAEFPEAPSRQRCIYLMRSLADVQQWVKSLGFEPNCFLVVRVNASGRTLDTDGNQLAADSEPLPVWREKARAYWRGENSPKPLPEVLFEGTIRVDEILNLSVWQGL